jgi:hypothetical protein
MKVFSVRGLLIASVLLALAAGGATAVLVVRLPSVVSQIPPAPMIVTLTRPLNGSGAGAGATIKVSAQVVTPNLVAAVELWADGQRVSEVTPTRAGTNLYLASLDWSPGPGPHVLVVRAADDQGHIGVSNVVRVEGVVGRESRRMEPFVAQGGETLDGLGQCEVCDAAVRSRNSLSVRAAGQESGSRVTGERVEVK